MSGWPEELFVVLVRPPKYVRGRIGAAKTVGFRIQSHDWLDRLDALRPMLSKDIGIIVHDNAAARSVSWEWVFPTRFPR